MAGSGRKTFSPGDVLTSSDVQNYLMDQSVMVFAGTAARASAIPSPSAGMVAYSTATALQVYNGSAWVDLSTGYGAASGTAASSTAITVAGTAYTLLTFTSSSTLAVTKSGLFDIWMIAGGGGGAGGGAMSFAAGGGGAGSRVQTTVYLSTNQTITIGAKGLGGTGGNNNGTQGTGSNVGALVSTAGGGAGLRTTQTNGQSNSGGCGGGGGDAFTTEFGATCVGTNFGFNGGASNFTHRANGPGGGGISAVGVSVTSNAGGAGGAGDDVSTFIGAGTAVYKGGGGGGYGNTTGGAAGNSSAGAGASGSNSGTAAAANSGSGGGSGSNSGGNGGDGICYVRFKV
jgi:hypothetical protein